jgi:two component transcriptional regulator, araC family
MYKLLIVDDELENLEWLEELFRYEAPRELEIYTALSARKAIEILNSVKCDIVLTDIKMPKMSGMELYHHIKENWPRCRVIFLTGYRDHETLYEAAQDKSVRYLLKTEGDAKIMDTVMEAVYELDRQREELTLERERGILFEKARYWIKKDFWEQAVTGTGIELPGQRKLEELGISLKADYPVLFFLGHIEEVGTNISRERVEGVMELITKSMPGILRIELCVMEQRYLLLLVQPKMLDAYTDWKRAFRVSYGALEDVQDICAGEPGLVIKFAVDREPVSFEQLSEKYYKLKKGIASMLSEEGSGIMEIRESAEEAGKEDCQFEAKLSRLPLLTEYLEKGSREEGLKVLSELTAPLLQGASRHDIKALELYYNISMIYLKVISLNGLEEKIPFRIGLYKLTNAESFNSWEEAVDYLKETYYAISVSLEESRGDRQDQTLNKVEKYIHEHLGEDLTLTVLADVGGFNAAYLSRIFKQKYQCNLSVYIINERVKQAKKLLVETDEKINRIGEMVGYLTPHSFTRVFKAAEGITPAEYRGRYRR